MQFKIKTILLILLLIFSPTCSSAIDKKDELLRGVLVEGLTVDLREPSFSDGILSTEKGGVIKGPDLRIQAKKITYIRKIVNEVPLCAIEAEGELMMELGEYTFVGDRLEYDFQTMEGLIYNGRTVLGPWYVGGEIVNLFADGSYAITNGFITTSENRQMDWQIASSYATLRDFRFLTAHQVKFVVGNFSPLWLNHLCLDLSTIFESPIKYTAGWGGKQGPRVGLVYEIFSWNRLKTFLRLDYRLRRGPGAGFETQYRSLDHRESFYTLNYIARDSSIFHSKERVRYWLQGAYSNLLFDDKVSIDLTYDKMSDKEVPDDYEDQSLFVETAGRTQLDIRRQEENWIMSLMARLRVNNFETIKQELPTFQFNYRPFRIGNTGIISENQFKASYLDFVYAHNVPHVHDYHSTRIALKQRLYRFFSIGPVILMPEIGSVNILYGNSPQNNAKWLVLGRFGLNLNLPLYQFYQNYKHVIVPYSEYSYYTFPTVSPDSHFIFDIDDGWYRLNLLRLGVHQSFYKKESGGLVTRSLYSDIWTNAFFDTETIHHSITKLYSRTILNTSPQVRHILDAAWDFEHNSMYRLNIRTEWTASTNFAIAAEYRHRNAFDWRKVDRDNFILDSFRSVEELRHSQLSDRRSVALLHFFYRFHPNWALEFESRHGWNRQDHTRFTEFEVDMLATLRSSANVKISYQHKESDDRIAVYFFVGLERPDLLKPLDLIPFIEF